MTTHPRHALKLLGLLGLLLALPARADTKAPVISDVAVSSKGGTVNVKARIADQTGVLEAKIFYRRTGDSRYEEQKLMSRGGDDFAATFNAGASLEYYITAVDELGNGPTQYGNAKQPHQVGKGGDAVAEGPRKRGRGRRKKVEVAQAEEKKEEAPAEEAPAEEKKEEPPAEEKKEEGGGEQAAAEEKKEDAGPPTVEHEKPAEAKEGEATALAVKITGNKITKATAYVRPKGQAKFVPAPLAQKEGDQWEASIPAELAKGTVEYIFTVIDEKNQKTQQGDGAPNKPFTLEFAKAGAPAKEAPADGYTFAHKPVVRTSPGSNINIRAQATPPNEAETPAKMIVLVRDAAGSDKAIELQPDESGGIGGFAGQIPASGEGALYYQLVACSKANKCGIDTGSKKSWHAVAVSNDADAKLPESIDAVSSKAPAGLPE